MRNIQISRSQFHREITIFVLSLFPIAEISLSMIVKVIHFFFKTANFRWLSSHELIQLLNWNVFSSKIKIGATARLSVCITCFMININFLLYTEAKN